MRNAALIFAALLALIGQAQAKSASPLFGGQAAGTFQVADVTALGMHHGKTVVQAAAYCTGPECGHLFKTANLPVSGKKP